MCDPADMRSSRAHHAQTLLQASLSPARREAAQAQGTGGPHCTPYALAQLHRQANPVYLFAFCSFLPFSYIYSCLFPVIQRADNLDPPYKGHHPDEPDKHLIRLESASRHLDEHAAARIRSHHVSYTPPRYSFDDLYPGRPGRDTREAPTLVTQLSSPGIHTARARAGGRVVVQIHHGRPLAIFVVAKYAVLARECANNDTPFARDRVGGRASQGSAYRLDADVGT